MSKTTFAQQGRAGEGRRRHRQTSVAQIETTQPFLDSREFFRGEEMTKQYTVCVSRWQNISYIQVFDPLIFEVNFFKTYTTNSWAYDFTISVSISSRLNRIVFYI